MTSQPRGRLVVWLLVVLLGAALGAGGMALLRPFGARGTGPPSGPPGRGTAGASLNDQAVYDKVEPSIVDVNTVLRFQDETAAGTGFVFNAPAALVLTNNHVIMGATSVTATFPSSGRTYQARVVGTDVGADVAVLQLLGATRLTAAPVGDSAAVTLGTPVLAIGNEAGQGGPPTIAPGIINSLGRTIEANDGSSGFTETLHGMLQTTARIEPGDSGGPLADAAGQVIGMSTASSSAGMPAAAGYAIPVNAALAEAGRIAAGRAGLGIAIGSGAFLGVIVPSSPAANPLLQAEEQQIPGTAHGASTAAPGCLATEAEARVPARIAPARSGALVDGVLCGTPAAAAGMAAGDVIIAVAGHAVSSPDVLTAVIGSCRPGATVPVTWANVTGTTGTALVRLAAAPAV